MDIRTNLKKLLPALPALLFPATAAAQLGGVPAPEGTLGGNDLVGAIILILNGLLVLAGVVALVYLIIGGVRYITSGGDDDQIGQAKSTILYAIIGLIVIGVAAVAVNFIITTVIGSS